MARALLEVSPGGARAQAGPASCTSDSTATLYVCRAYTTSVWCAGGILEVVPRNHRLQQLQLAPAVCWTRHQSTSCRWI